MSRENRNLIILAVSAVVLGLLFIVGLSTYNKEVAKQKTLKYYQSYISETKTYKSEKLDSGILQEKITLLDGDTEVGYVYVASDTATGIPLTQGESVLRLHVFVSKDSKIKGVVVDYSEHTPEYVEKLTPYFNNLKDADLIDYKKVDTVAGASAFTEPIVIKALDQVTKLVTGRDPNPAVEIDPYEEVFGEYESKEEDSAFTTTETLTKKEIIKDTEGNVIGFAYTATGTREGIPYHDGPARVTLLVGVKEDGTVLGVYKLKVEHTASYFSYHDPFFENLKGKNISEYETVDTVAGATVSWGLIKELLDAVKGVS